MHVVISIGNKYLLKEYLLIILTQYNYIINYIVNYIINYSINYINTVYKFNF